MSRVQLALNVADLDAAVAFYSRLFAVPPHKLRPGYANFEVDDPPLKLVLIETGAERRGRGTAGALNHLGVEVAHSDEVSAATARLRREGLVAREEHDTICCHARQDKVWVYDPAGTPWEVYVITDDQPTTEYEEGCCRPGSAPDVVAAPEAGTVATPPLQDCCP